MRRVLRGKWHRTAALARRHGRPFGLAAFGLALSLVLIGGSPSLAQAARLPGLPLLASEPHSLTVPALGRATMTTAAGDGLIARTDSVTTSEPDHDGLNPVYISVTNPDREYTCADPGPAQENDASGRVRAPDACGALDLSTDADGLP